MKPAPRRPHRPAPGIPGEVRYWLYFFSWILARVVFFILFGLRLRGTENIPARGGLLIASNHQSFLDPIIVGIALGPWRQVHYMARDTLFVGPFGWLIRIYNAFPVRRGGADHRALKEARARLEAGLPVLVFPEGTRSRDGRLQKIRPGAAQIALSCRVPVLPCFIHNAYRAWPRGKKFFRPIRGMRVYLGKVIDTGAYSDDRAGRRALTDDIARALAELQERAYSGE